MVEEAFVIVADGFLLALVSNRVWRRLPFMPAEMRTGNSESRRGLNVCAIGSELFFAGGFRDLAADGRVVGYDAVDEDWFDMPGPDTFPNQEVFAVACDGQLAVGVYSNRIISGYDYGTTLDRWDQDAHRWI